MARVKIDGDAAGVVGAQKEAKDSAKLLNNEYKDMQREMRGVERQAKKTWDEARTPLERYNTKVAKLKDLLDQGRLSKDQYAAAVGRANRQMKIAETSGQRAFGNAAIMAVTKYAASIGAITIAIRTSIDAYRQLDQERAAIAAKIKGPQFAGIGQLGQLATSDADLAALKQASFDIEGFGVDQGEAQQLAFNLRSAGQLTENNKVLMARAASVKLFSDPGQMISAAAVLQKNLGGTFGDILSAATVASGETQTTIDRLLFAVAKPAQIANELGMSREQTLSLVTLLSQGAATPDVAGTQAASFLEQVSRSRGTEFDLTDNTVQGIMSKIQGFQERGISLREMLGDRKEGLNAARFVQREGIGAFNDIGKKIQEGVKTNAFGERLSITERGQSLLRERREEAQREVRRRHEAIRREERIGAVERGVDLAREAGRGPIEQMITRKIGDAFQLLGAGENAINLGQMFGTAPAASAYGGLTAPDQALKQLVEATNRTAANTQPRATVPTPEEP